VIAAAAAAVVVVVVVVVTSEANEKRSDFGLVVSLFCGTPM